MGGNDFRYYVVCKCLYLDVSFLSGDNHTYKNVEGLKEGCRWKESIFTFYLLFTQQNKNKCYQSQKILKESHSDIQGSFENKIQL